MNEVMMKIGMVVGRVVLVMVIVLAAGEVVKAQENVTRGKVEVGQSDVGQSDVGKSDVGKSDVGKVDVGKSDVGKADVGKVDVGKSDVGKVDVGRVEVGRGEVWVGDVGRGDGPREGVDSVGMGVGVRLGVGMGVGNVGESMRLMGFCLPQGGIVRPEFLDADQFDFETKEQRAARINAGVHSSVMESINRNLYGDIHRYDYRHRGKGVLYLLSVGRLFLSNPYGYAEGYAPLMNHSNPFVTVKVPGQAPYFNKYSPDLIPQAIRAEFDLSTGKWKPVMNDWKDFELHINHSYGGQNSTEPVPRVKVTPVERNM